MDVRIIDLANNVEEPVLGVVGRYAVEKELVIDQQMQGGNLVATNKSYDTAPSSIFLFILNTHRLLYIDETVNAPGVQSFINTLNKFIIRQRKSILSQLWQEEKKKKKMRDELK